MAKRFFQTLSTTLQQHCPQHVRHYHPINKTRFHNKTSHFSFSPKLNPSVSFSSSSSSFNNVGFVAWYLRKLQTNPFITKGITSSLIYTAADLTSHYGENRPEVIARLKQDLRLFWPVCDIVTFGFIPVHLQPLMNSCCAYLWIVYCSRIAKRTNLTEA